MGGSLRQLTRHSVVPLDPAMEAAMKSGMRDPRRLNDKSDHASLESAAVGGSSEVAKYAHFLSTLGRSDRVRDDVESAVDTGDPLAKKDDVDRGYGFQVQLS